MKMFIRIVIALLVFSLFPIIPMIFSGALTSIIGGSVVLLPVLFAVFLILGIVFMIRMMYQGK